MSRTKKGSKGPGYELWGKRAMCGMPHGRDSKRLCNQKERAMAKQDLLKEPREPEYDPREYVDKCLEGDCHVCGNYPPRSDCTCADCQLLLSQETKL